jgi:hypothetical protein
VTEYRNIARPLVPSIQAINVADGGEQPGSGAPLQGAFIRPAACAET